MSRWLRSEKAVVIFFYSAWVVVCAGIFILFAFTPWFSQIDSMPHGEILLRVLGGALGVVGAPASLIIWLGMMIFCVREDRSPTAAKIFWFIVFFATAWFGAAAYFFSVYTKQVHSATKTATP